MMAKQKMRTSRAGEYLHSTPEIEYTVRHYEYGVPTSGVKLTCGGLVMSDIGANDTRIVSCRLTSKDNYYQIEERRFVKRLRTCYPCVSRRCAAKVARSFIEILRIANATHGCVECHPGVPFTVGHHVVIKIQPHHHHHHREAAVGPMRWPATRASVAELLMKASASTTTTRAAGCAICMEEEVQRIEMLAMPCSHVFHRTCLLRWLDDNNVCPLCRYPLPRAEYRSIL